MEPTQRFARSQGFSSHVAKQASLARRSSSRADYQAKWAVYRQWCRSEGHSISRLSLSKVADFLFWLRRSRKLSVSAVLGYRSMLSAVFRFQLPEISSSSVIRDLLRSFKVEAPCHAVCPTSWDLEAVLSYLRSPVFEPLASCSLRELTRKTLFLVSLATAKRVGEIQALISCGLLFFHGCCGLSYVPEFLAKTETAVRPLPRSFSIQSFQDFAAGLPEDLLLCPVRSSREYLRRTSCLLIGLVDFSFLLDVLLMQCRKTVSLSCFERLLFIQVPVWKVVLFLGLIVFVALLPLPLFLKTGRFLVCSRQPHGNLIQFSLLFILGISSMFLKEFAPWVLLSPLGSTLVSLHLFLIFSRG